MLRAHYPSYCVKVIVHLLSKVVVCRYLKLLCAIITHPILSISAHALQSIITK